MERVLVTGATGFLGGTLLRHLRAAGRKPVALGRQPDHCRRLGESGFPTFRADLSQPLEPGLAAAIGPVDAVVHCAALSAPWGRMDAFRAANVTATGTVLDLAEALGARRFVNISSPSVYFEMKDKELVAEASALPPPVNAYAATKAEAEQLVLARQVLGPIILRPRGIYGIGDSALLPRLLSAAKRRPLPVFRGGIASIDLTHVSDVLAAIDAALMAPAAVTGEIFNISGGEPLPVREIVERACAIHRIPVRWRRQPLAPAVLAARVLEQLSLALPGGREPVVTPYAIGLFAFRQSLDIFKAARLLNWRPQVTFADGLRRLQGQGDSQ